MHSGSEQPVYTRFASGCRVLIRPLAFSAEPRRRVRRTCAIPVDQGNVSPAS
ncbi:protein of unknown function [Streptomyces murinus]